MFLSCSTTWFSWLSYKSCPQLKNKLNFCNMHASGKFDTIYHQEIFFLIVIYNKRLGQTDYSVTSDDEILKYIVNSQHYL